MEIVYRSLAGTIARRCDRCVNGFTLAGISRLRNLSRRQLPAPWAETARVPSRRCAILGKARSIPEESDARRGRAYLAGEFSVADVALYPVIAVRSALIDGTAGLANLKAWQRRVDRERHGGERIGARLDRRLTDVIFD